jgi:hypothetical protein
VSEEGYLAQFGVSSTPHFMGEAVLQVLTDPALDGHCALLTATGLARQMEEEWQVQDIQAVRSGQQLLGEDERKRLLAVL